MVCVSNIDEASELRLAGLSKKILILGFHRLEAVSLAKKIRHHLDSGRIGVDSNLLARGTDLSGLTVSPQRLTQDGTDWFPRFQ